MHINDTWSKASRPAQLLAMLVTTALVLLGVTSLPTYAAAPTLKLAINADEDSYLSGVEQRYVVEFSCASTTEDCLNSVVTITLPHTITPAGDPNPDSAPDGVNATATAGNKVVTPEIKRTWPDYQTKGGTTIQMRDKVGTSTSVGTHKNEADISATEPEYALTFKSTTICFYGSTDDSFAVYDMRRRQG